MTTVGIDVGSTFVKAVLVDEDGAEVLTARRPTPWRSFPHSRAEVAPLLLLDAVGEVLAELAAAGRRVRAIGVSGMAEAGTLLDPADRPTCAVVAWFDQRGGDSVSEVPEPLREEFAGRTGLPLGPLATFTKLWHRSRHEEVVLADRQWLNVPELVAWWLGGERRAEVSLAARTGLLDQDTAAVWPSAVEALGVTPDLVPPLATAGSVWGLASRHVPDVMSGAVLTVGGHDHLVSSTASGVLDTRTLYDSMGTAEALVRVLDGVLDSEARARLAGHGVNVVRHVLPGHGVMLAGIRSGLLMRRALQLVGVGDAAGRARIDHEVMALPPGPVPGVEVSGADNADGTLTVRADADGLSPAALFQATLQHGNDVLAGVLAWMDAESEPAVGSILAGGWAAMDSVRRARSGVLPNLRWSDHEEDTAYGASLIAGFAAEPDEHDLTRYLTRALAVPAGAEAVTAPTTGGTSR